MSHTGKKKSIDKRYIEVDKTKKKGLIHAIQKYGSCYSDQNLSQVVKGCPILLPMKIGLGAKRI